MTKLLPGYGCDVAMATALTQKMNFIKDPSYMSNLSGESREQNCKDKVTRFRSVTYARQLGLLVNTLGSHPKSNLVLQSKRP